MDKKTIKYKFKKNKLENEIINILNNNKKIYEESILESNNNQIIINKIDKFIIYLDQKDKLNKQQTFKQIIILIGGFYSVGKTTFINHLEDYILIQSKQILNNQYINLIKKLSINNDTDTDTDIEIINSEIINTDQILIIEFDINLINKINLLLQNDNIVIINIIPKNINSLKNKYINKIIYDLQNNTNNFIDNISLLVDKNKQIFDTIKLDNINLILNNIYEKKNILKLKKKFYIDKDFNFLDDIISIIFDLIKNNTNNLEKNNLDIHKYYL
jgi:hypothetical protein